MNSPQAPADSWAQLFAGGRLRSSPAASNHWSNCYVDVVENAPPQPEYVRTEQGSYHGLVLFTDQVKEAEDRLKDGPLHFSGAGPGDLHVYSRARNEEPHLSRWYNSISFVSVRLSASAVAKACRAANLDYDSTTFDSRFAVNDPFLRQMVRQFARTLKNAQEEQSALSHRMYVEQLTQAAAAHLVQHYTAQQPVAGTSPSGLPPERLHRVEEYVEAHLDQNINLEDLAAVACYSEYHFCRAFKRSTGHSPYQYVIQRRLDKAARLLRTHPHRRVATVARAVGYDSPSHFSRQFKKHHGVPPSRWQQAVQQ